MCWMGTTQRCLHTEQQVRINNNLFPQKTSLNIFPFNFQCFPAMLSPIVSPNVFYWGFSTQDFQCYPPMFSLNVSPQYFILRFFHSIYNQFPMLSLMFSLIFSPNLFLLLHWMCNYFQRCPPNVFSQWFPTQEVINFQCCVIVDCYAPGGGKTYTMVGQPVRSFFPHVFCKDQALRWVRHKSFRTILE